MTLLHSTCDAGHGGSDPRASRTPPTCADATQNTHPLKEVVVKIGSKKVADVKGIKAIKKGLTLKKLPASGSYKISVTATTLLKKKLTGSQSYKACTKGSGKIGLKGGKKHH
jgi:hypothetical protein